MKFCFLPAAVAALLLLVAIFATSTMASLTVLSTLPVSSVTRYNNGDTFTAPGDDCSVDTCVGLSSGTAGASTSSSMPTIAAISAAATSIASTYRPSDGGGTCVCRCLQHLPAYRDDLHICVDDIHECSLAPFVSGSTSQQIPFVFLPLKGQIVHPSKEINFAGVKTPICAISGAQFLTESGWVELRNPIDNDVPFRLFRDEGRTFLQWLGDTDLRIKMGGRLILVQMLCKDLAKDPTGSDLNAIFTPCVAFRVAGTPTKFINNVSEVIFSPDAHASNDLNGGLTINEYIAIGICSILLGLIYVASVFLYLHIKKRRKKECIDKDVEKRDDQSLAPDDEVVIKNNPLLNLGRHFLPAENTFSDSASSDEMPPDLLQHQDESRKKTNQTQITSAIIHPLNENFSMSFGLCNSESTQIQDNTSIERLPEENVSIVETLEGREDRPETVKAIVSATTRRKLYFNPAYFEPHLLLAPPPAAIEFLTKIREVISIAKLKMATKRFTPSLMGIPEEESNHSAEHLYDFSVGPASSRRSSMISLKRENSRRKLQECAGCPECEPQDLKSLCGKLPEFPNMAVCKSCSRTSLVSESKQQSIRKWLEDVPILKTVENEDLPELDSTLNETINLTTVKPQVYENYKNNIIKNEKPKTISIDKIQNEFLHNKADKKNIQLYENYKNLNSLDTPKLLNEHLKEKVTTKSKPVKNKAPAPPIPPLQTSLKHLENFKPNLSNQYDIIRNVRYPIVKQNLPPPDMINEAMVVDKAEEVPQVAKQMMAAVINEFTTHCKIEEQNDISNNLNKAIIDYETDSLEKNGKSKNGYSTPTEYADVTSSNSQPSPSLSAALPMDEEMTMQNDIFKNKTLELDEEHEYELIVLPKQDKKSLVDILDKKLYRLPELLQRNNGYNLVSEVYVNNGYNFGSAPSTPTDSNASTLEHQKPKIRYEQPDEKPGRLTIEVEDCPDNYIRVEDSDNFEPDTLDRKSNKFRNINCSDGTMSSDYVDSLERTKHILLKTTGSFKSDTLNSSSNNNYNLNSNFNRTFGSLREIYEAKTRNYLRPSLDNITFLGPLQQQTNTDFLQKTYSWKRNNNLEEGKLLTLEERQKKRQRESPKGSLRQIPPDVIPPSPIQSPIYEHPKPPRKVLLADNKPPLPPKNGNGRNTSLKISSPFSTMSLDLSSPSGVSAQSHSSLDGELTLNTKPIDKNNNITFINNQINSQFILHPKDTNTFTFPNNYCPSLQISDQIPNLDAHLNDQSNSESIKKTWRKLVQLSETQLKEDSGYLSTESNDSNKKKKDLQLDKESDTDESLGDGHSESGAESIETHSVFFGSYRKFSRVAESIDSGVGSDYFQRKEIVLLPDISTRINKESSS